MPKCGGISLSLLKGDHINWDLSFSGEDLGGGYFLTHYILISSVSILEQRPGKMPVAIHSAVGSCTQIARRGKIKVAKQTATKETTSSS